MTIEKSLGNSDANGTAQNVPDVEFFGNGDTFQLLCKASSRAEGWMKSTKALEIPGAGCLVQVTTQQRNPDGFYAVAEALAFVPGVRVVFDKHGGRALVAAGQDRPDPVDPGARPAFPAFDPFPYELAARLGDDQAALLLWMHQNQKPHTALCFYYSDAANTAARALERSGCLTSQPCPDPDVSAYRLTPLGEQVASHIRTSTSRDDLSQSARKLGLWPSPFR